MSLTSDSIAQYVERLFRSHLFWVAVGLNPGKTLLLFFVIFSLVSLVYFFTDMHLIIMSFMFTRQLDFNVSCICKETLIKGMAKLVLRYSDDVMTNYH